jgi:hypothetical protein
MSTAVRYAPFAWSGGDGQPGAPFTKLSATSPNNEDEGQGVLASRGVRDLDLPVTPHHIWAILHGRGAGVRRTIWV